MVIQVSECSSSCSWLLQFCINLLWHCSIKINLYYISFCIYDITSWLFLHDLFFLQGMHKENPQQLKTNNSFLFNNDYYKKPFWHCNYADLSFLQKTLKKAIIICFRNKMAGHVDLYFILNTGLYSKAHMIYICATI